MLFRKKIPCYVMVFDQLDIIKRCLDSLCLESDRLDIVVIENPSDNTPVISKYVERLGRAGKIKRYYLFDKNITNNALHAVWDAEIELIRKSRFVLISDGDLVPQPDWLNEELSILKRNPDVWAVGITLERSNLPLKTFPDADKWLAEDTAEHADYYETVTGAHLEMHRGPEFYEMMKAMRAADTRIVDTEMHHYGARLGKKWARTKKTTAYHLTWDLYADLNHPYTKLRLGKSHKQTWQHTHRSDYKLTTY